MLLKIVTGDHLHSPLLDVETGRAFLTTVSCSMDAALAGRRNSVSSETTSSSSSSSSSTSSLPAAWDHPIDRFADGSPIPVPGRHIWVLDAEQNVAAEMVFDAGCPLAIKFAGREPIVGQFCSTSLFAGFDNQDDMLVVPTRIDDFEWIVTKSSMTLADPDGYIAMAYHPHARLDDTGCLRATSLRPGAAFLSLHEGLHHLEKEELAELFVTFCLMEILRRGRFNLAPYAHDTPRTLERYRVMLRDKYLGAAGSKVHQLLGRLGLERGQQVAS